MSLRHAVHAQLDPEAWTGRGLSPVNRALAVVIVVATAVAILQTEPLVVKGNEKAFATGEACLAVVFVIEYAARLWSCREDPRYQRPVLGRWRWATTPSALLDLAVVVLTLTPLIAGNAFALRLLRLLALARFAKMSRLSGALRHLAATVAARRYELGLTAMLAGAVVVAAASAMWWLEGDVQPDKFGSIPRSMWWSAVTLTTIGYGDVYPLTTAGKILSVAVALTGIGLIAMPTGILAAAFSDALARQRSIASEQHEATGLPSAPTAGKTDEDVSGADRQHEATPPA